jgi:hypothetical protein
MFLPTHGQEKKKKPVESTGCGAAEAREIADPDWPKVV